MIVRAGRRISLAALPMPPLSRFDLLSALATGLVQSRIAWGPARRAEAEGEAAMKKL